MFVYCYLNQIDKIHLERANKKKPVNQKSNLIIFFEIALIKVYRFFRYSYNSIEFEDLCTFLIIPTYLHLRVNAGLNIPIVYDHVNHVHAMQPLPSFFDYFNHMYYTNAACKPFFHSYSLLFFSTKLRLRWNIVSYTCVQISISLSFFLILWQNGITFGLSFFKEKSLFKDLFLFIIIFL